MSDELKIRLVRYDEIDKKQFSSLQKMVFTTLVQKVGDVSFSPDFYNWKYNTPFGKAWIAIAEKKGKIIGSNSMIPLNLIVQGKETKSWQSCDTAVLPEERGKGIFYQCISELNSQIKAGEIFWGFPNRNSIGGLLKLGFRKNSFIKLWIKPLFFFNNKELIPPDEGITEPAIGGIIIPNHNYVEKNKEYIQWRYFQNPSYHYHMLNIGSGNDTTSVFLRQLNVKRRKLLMIMEFTGEEKGIISGFDKVRSFAKTNNIHYIGYLGNALPAARLFALGFLPVPDFLLPKTQILCINTYGDNDLIDKQPWIIHTGDYDLF